MYLAGKTKDLRNIFRECRKHSVKDPCQISSDELKAEFLVCKYNIELLKKHSPYFRLKFLTSLVTNATSKGNTAHTSKLTGVIHKERSRKQ
jgi:hypothetical protein